MQPPAVENGDGQDMLLGILAPSELQKGASWERARKQASDSHT